MRVLFSALIAIVTVLICGCGPNEETLSLQDAKMKIFGNMYEVNRSNTGLSTIPQVGIATVIRQKGMTASRMAYDAEVVIKGKSLKHLLFKKVDGTFILIDETEWFTGPGLYNMPSGPKHESIGIHYCGFLQNGNDRMVSIWYRGADSNLRSKSNVSLADVEPIIKNWGY